MSQPHPVNPLIKDDQASTIDAISHFVEYMIIQKANDGQTHPGEVLQLEVLRQAILSVRIV